MIHLWNALETEDQNTNMTEQKLALHVITNAFRNREYGLNF